jgi:hypothetical protein
MLQLNKNHISFYSMKNVHAAGEASSCKIFKVLVRVTDLDGTAIFLEAGSGSALE